jgi:ABC-type bacteriocin/lantibiotic exporter with double-glycine peptidase domain
MAALFAILAVIYLFTVSPPLALIPIAVIIAGVFAFARWEQRRFRPPGT